MVGRALCEAHADRADAELRGLFDSAVEGPRGVGRPHDGSDAGAGRGLALVALGGYGRRELSLQSDLDVLLLHDGSREISAVADAIWYPVWDAGVKLGHAVRTSKETLTLAADDLDSATALLQARFVAGDEAIAQDLIAQAAEQWVKKAKRFLPELGERVKLRHAQAGEVAFLLEPDLKEGRGGLRDVQSLHWAERARGLLWEGDDRALADAYDVLLGARVELHRRTGRPGDTLALQEQDAVAEALGDEDADALMQRVAAAARVISFRSDDTWRRVEASLRGPLGRIGRRDRTLGPSILARDGEIHLAPAADLTDPVLGLRLLAIATAEDLPVHRSTLDRLQELPPLPSPWSDEAREAFVAVLAAGRAAIGHLESFDQHGLLTKVLPEWEAVRSKPQRNAYHRYTVDRHLCEAAANAAALAARVRRPDLLLVGTLLHDIGKGFPGDHTEVGMEMVADLARRMGFDADDVATLVALVEHHLLLPDVATRRDLDDPDVIDRVAEELGSVERLELLHALTEADSQATGPAAWSPWKAELVATLAGRVRHVLGGGEVDDVTGDFPTDEQLVRLRQGDRFIEGEGQTLTVIDVDRPGLFSRVAGTLALHGLAVLHADIATIDGRALEVLTVESTFGPTFAWPAVEADLDLALDGRLALRARLADREEVYRRTRPSLAGAAKVEFHEDDSSTSTVVEVHAPDSVGVLYRITDAIAELQLDIVRARIQTLLDEVVDSFYVCAADGGKIPPSMHDELRRAILFALR